MSRGRVMKYRTGYAFVLPWILGLALFVAYPFVAAMYFSLCDYPPLRGPMYIGLDNYRELLSDPVFHRSLGVTVVYAAVAIPLGVVLALTLAMLLNARIRGQSFYRVVFYLPHLVPVVVVALLWLWIFNPQVGLLNMVSRRVMAGVDWWTARFFDLAALKSRAGPDPAPGAWCLRRETLWLLAAPAGAFLCWGPLGRRLWRRDSLGRRLLALAAAAALVLAAVAAVSALLYVVAPRDMAKFHSPGWLTDANPMPAAIPFAPAWALWALIVMSMWGVGEMAIIYLAKLQDVPVELYEAADIDGANWWQKIRSVTVPMISPVILFNVVMAIIGTFQVFAAPYIMTGGGPEDRTRFVAMFVYDQAFQYHRIGYAAAVSAVLFLIIVALTLLAFHISRKHVHYFGR